MASSEQRTEDGVNLTKEEKALWRGAWDRITCPVAKELFKSFVTQGGPIPEPHRTRFFREIASLRIPRSTRKTEWKRAALLADRAVRVFVPLALDVVGTDEARKVAAELRRRKMAKETWEFREIDRYFASHERHHIAAEAAAWAAGKLGDEPAPGHRHGRMFSAERSSTTMQSAGCWGEGIDALLALARIKDGAD